MALRARVIRLSLPIVSSWNWIPSLVFEQAPQIFDMHHAAVRGRADHDVAFREDGRLGWRR
jgi:hypothetical protein